MTLHTHASTNFDLREKMFAQELQHPSLAQDIRSWRRRLHKEDNKRRADAINPRVLAAIDITDVLNKLFEPFMERTAGKGVDLTPRNRNTQRRKHSHSQQLARQRRQAGMQEAAAKGRLARLRDWLRNEHAA